MARFNQSIRYDDFPFYATDIDSLTHISKRLWLVNESKCEGTDITRSQEITLKDMVNDLGCSKPTFAVVTHHNTRPTEAITGENLLVSYVYFKAPHMKSVVTHEYQTEDRPTFNRFQSILSFVVGVEDKLKAGHTIEIASDDPFFNQYPNLRPEIIKVFCNDEMMQSFAELDDWDEMTEEQKAFIYACGAFSELDFYDYHYLTWANQQ
jgi:hypothetical protein